MKQANPIAEGIFEAAKAKGFRKAGSNFYLQSDETVLVINLQRSQWGNQYYINLVLIIKSILTESVWKPPPKQSSFHIEKRLEELFPNYPMDEEGVKTYLDLEDATFNDLERVAWVSEKVSTYGIPFLQRYATEHAIREGYRSRQLIIGQIWKEMRGFLDG